MRVKKTEKFDHEKLLRCFDFQCSKNMDQHGKCKIVLIDKHLVEK